MELRERREEGERENEKEKEGEERREKKEGKRRRRRRESEHFPPKHASSEKEPETNRAVQEILFLASHH